VTLKVICKEWIEYDECQWHIMIWLTSNKSKDDIPQWDLYKNYYMAQPKDFIMERKERKGCHMLKYFMD
jgi:hypothetical protein